MRYDTILFDMDGTLMKTEKGVLNGFRYAMEKMGRPMPEGVPDRLYMGPPLLFSFQEYCGLSFPEAEEAVRQYRVYYNGGGIMECEVYEGVRELLETLRAAGLRLLVASSKPEEYVRRILRAFRLDGLFSFAGGATMDESRSEKPDVLRYVFREAGVTDLSRCLMVGDRSYDVLGAAAFGMDAMGVLWGYGERAELEKSGARFLAETPREAARLILEASEGEER